MVSLDSTRPDPTRPELDPNELDPNELDFRLTHLERSEANCPGVRNDPCVGRRPGSHHNRNDRTQ